MSKTKPVRPSDATPGPFSGLLPGVLPGPRRPLSAKLTLELAIQAVSDLCDGHPPAEQWELHLRLARELYSRAVNGWARVEVGLNGVGGEGGGI